MWSSRSTTLSTLPSNATTNSVTEAPLASRGDTSRHPSLDLVYSCASRRWRARVSAVRTAYQRGGTRSLTTNADAACAATRFASNCKAASQVIAREETSRAARCLTPAARWHAPHTSTNPGTSWQLWRPLAAQLRSESYPWRGDLRSRAPPLVYLSSQRGARPAVHSMHARERLAARRQQAQ